MSDIALRFDGVSKRYGRAAKPALDGLSFHVPKGSITAFVGPNGAGKTTTFSVVGGYLLPDSGTIDLLGEPTFDAAKLKGRLGLLPQDAELPDRHTPLELVGHLARLQGMSAAEAAREAERVVELVGLKDRKNWRIHTLSHGMRRRVAVATALAGSPELVLLDEPLAGLDPVQANSLRDALAGLAGIQTLVVSGHNLTELERFCDWVVMVAEGRCLRCGSMSEVTGATHTATWQLSAPPPSEVLAALEGIAGQTFRIAGAELTQTASRAEDLDASSVDVMQLLAAHRVAVRGVRRGVALEESFLGSLSAAGEPS